LSTVAVAALMCRGSVGQILQQFIFKDYLTASSGQVHRRYTLSAAAALPLYCLHATAYSGRSFEPFMRAMGDRRRVVALDTPGYGASDRPAERWDIPRYAAAIGEAIEASGDGPVDLFGYHTGALLAVELAVQKPHLIRRVVLLGVPFFRGQEREDWRMALGKPMHLTDQLSQFEERWDFFITSRTDGVPLDQGFANFFDELAAYPHGWWSHDAAFRYPAEQRLPLMTQPCLVLNPDNHLTAPSRAAAKLLPSCEVAELPHLSNAVLDLAARETADRIDVFLRAEVSQDFERPASMAQRAQASPP
jgi:pimeloyl-ACP methyl ester carboxylesterase